jgi:hypothetical protein
MYTPLINGGNVGSEYIVGILPIVTNTNGKISSLPPIGSSHNSLFENGYENAYIGDMLELIDNTVGGTTTSLHEYRKILDYRIIPASESEAYITTTIDAAEPILTTSVPLVSTFGCDIDNIFTGWTIEFTAATDTGLVGTTRTIDFYRGYDRRVFFNEPILDETITAADSVVLKSPIYEVRIDAPFSIGALSNIADNCGFDDNTTFRIRDGCNIPISTGTLAAGSQNTFTLPASAGATDYTGYLIWITSDPVVFSGALTSASIVTSGGTQIQGTFVLPAGASVFADDVLNNMTITMTGGNFSGFSFIITDWDNGTLTGTITPGWTALTAGTTAPAGGDTFTITQPNPTNYRRIASYNTTTLVGTVNTPFSYTNQLGTTTKYAVTSSDTYEILQFKGDNYHPLDYPESVVHQQQAHCYDISLISLTLPNVHLKSGLGGHIAFYPYVYVEFRGGKGKNTNEFNSNNPEASNRAMFRAPMVYNYEPRDAAFITLDGHDMVQTLKFTPNDSYSFAVYLPNGELFLTDEDYFSPSEPNPLLQISACFGVKRLGNLTDNRS